MMPIRVMVVDDHAVVRKGIRALLEAEPDLTVVGEAGNGAEAMAEADRCDPDVVLMDLIMPRMDGVEATRRLTARRPGMKILVLTSSSADDKVFPALDAGAAGYLLKDASLEELVESIRRVHRGEVSLHPSITRKVLRELASPTDRAPAPESLTERELDVLRLVALGQSNRQIGKALHISEATVRTHVSNILAKLHLNSRTQAALYALRGGLVGLEET